MTVSGILDFHTHTFPDRIAAGAVSSLQAKSHSRAFSDGTEAGLAARARAAGITRCVVLPVATSPRQVVHINDSSIRIAQTAEETGLTSLGCMHPDYEDWSGELARIAEAGLKGIKLHPVYQGVDMDDARMLRILARCGELGLFVLIHAGYDIGFPGAAQATPEKVRRALAQAGPVRLIAAHMGGWRCWEEAADLLGPLPNVMIDTAFSVGRITPLGDAFPWTEEGLRMLSPEETVRLIRRWGPERVLFGTDSPWSDQAEAVRDFLALPLTDAEREAILWRNGAALLGMRTA